MGQHRSALVSYDGLSRRTQVTPPNDPKSVYVCAKPVATPQRVAPERFDYSGQVRPLWVDAQTFLEVKIEGAPRRIAGKMRPVEIYYRDYKSVNGLMVPYVLETTVQAAKQSHNMTIENVVVKPKLEHSLFTVPKIK